MSEIETGSVVRGFFATDREHEACRGEVVGYYDRPAVLIRTEGGRCVTWMAHLTEKLDREQEREYWRSRCRQAEDDQMIYCPKCGEAGVDLVQCPNRCEHPHTTGGQDE